MTVRVRFAPSPTGPLHMGGVRTALYNYIFAKQNNGVFILRIEDTDQERYVEGTEEYIVESLKWCGIKIDEGYGVGGTYGPYKQSERKEIYLQYAKQLIKDGKAYYAFDTPEDIDKKRKQSEETGDTFIYNQKQRKLMKNSLTLSENDVNKLLEDKTPYVIRFLMPENYTVNIEDIIRGQIEFKTETLDDKVLFKSDGLPTYHLANIVDDHMMKISHVIRGEEWLPSLPLHIMLYDALQWTDTMPKFAHLPLLLKPTGKGKLSKRDGEKLGFPVFPLAWTTKEGNTATGYKEEGYFPEAFVNMLVLLGWNPGTSQEIMNMDEIIANFDLNKVQKSGARFDPEKAKWFNHQYLIAKSNEEIASEFRNVLKLKGIEEPFERTVSIVSLIKERVQFVHEIWEQSQFFYVAPNSYDEKTVKKRWKNNIPTSIEKIKNLLSKEDKWQSNTLKELVSDYINANELGFGAILNALRLCIVGGAMGPDLFLILELIGKNETIKRLNMALSTLPASN